jgi:hypothetical protein
MKKFNTKSAIIGRKKRENKSDLDYPLFIHMFDENNPHTSGSVPKEMIEFSHTSEVKIKNLEIKYLLAGNDILINNLKEIIITEKKPGYILITGTQD